MDSKKPEDEIVKDILTTLDDKLVKSKQKKANESYKFVKSSKNKGKFKLFVKAKNMPEVLTVITNLAGNNIEVRKTPKWRR